MSRFLFFCLACAAILLTQCQSSHDEKSYSYANFVVHKDSFKGSPLKVEEELKPHLAVFIENLPNLRKIEYVSSFSDPDTIASCESYEVLQKDKIEDDLLKTSKEWFEVTLLESEFSSGKDLAERVQHVLSSCLSGGFLVF